MMSADSAATLLSVTGSGAIGLPGAISGAGLGGGKVSAMSEDQINATSKDFESMFISQMLEQMFGDSIGSEAFGDSETSEVYKGMMMSEYGKQIAQAGGIGIADYVKRELLKLQEK